MDTDEEEIELAMDWIKDFEKMYSAHLSYPKEKMQSLSVYSLYIENDCIVKMHKRKRNLCEDRFAEQVKQFACEGLEGFRDEWLLHSTELVSNPENIEKEWKELSQSSFVLTDVLFFNMELEPEKIQAFSDVSVEEAVSVLSPFFRSFSCFVSLNPSGGYDQYHWGELEKMERWGDSVFLFHCWNAVFFLYRKLIPSSSVPTPSKSILIWKKNEGGSSLRKTRRVQFSFADSSEDGEEKGEWEGEEDGEEEDQESGLENIRSKNQWMKLRRKNNQTRKRKHTLNSNTIKQLFSSL